MGGDLVQNKNDVKNRHSPAHLFFHGLEIAHQR